MNKLLQGGGKLAALRAGAMGQSLLNGEFNMMRVISSQPQYKQVVPQFDQDFQSHVKLGEIRNDWTKEEIQQIYDTPLLDLVFKASYVHRMHNDPQMVQRCTLLSIKTGGCPENCNYCSQSKDYSKETGTKAEPLMQIDEVLEAAARAKAAGSTRFCMGAAWRGPSQVGPRQFERVLGMVKGVRAMGLEVCATLGMLNAQQAQQLKDAGLSAYNHNVDTSPEYYGQITQTRKFEDRLDTISTVQGAGISVCSGGILGLGEQDADRVSMLQVLASLPQHPESVPINALVAVKGTPMENNEPVSTTDMVRTIATARILMPKCMLRLSAGRMTLGLADQALCFMAGANSIFDGDKLLTTPNNDRNEDLKMFEQLGLTTRPAFYKHEHSQTTA